MQSGVFSYWRNRLALTGLLFASALRAQAPPHAAVVVKAGKYACVFTDATGRHVVPGFEIRGDGTYVHRNNSTGTYEIIPKKSQILFRQGSLDNTLALYDDSNPKAAFIRLYNAKRTETILSCQTRK